MQPSYLPWVGYFNMIDACDQFVLFDNVQFSHKSWHHRNRIRGRDGSILWLTVPTLKPHRKALDQTLIAGDNWRRKHWRSIQSAYAHTPHWEALEHTLSPIYQREWQRLTDLTATLIRALARYLDISTMITLASSVPDQRASRDERIHDIVASTHATHFLEPTTVGFLGTHIGGAQITWHHYTPYPYTQGSMPWQPYLSVIDLIAWHGTEALTIIRQGYNPNP